MGRNVLPGPDRNKWDLGLLKSFQTCRWRIDIEAGAIGKRASLIQRRNQEACSRQVPGIPQGPESVGIKPLSVFDTGLGTEIPIDKIGGSRPAESIRRRAVAPPGRYACADG
jgi:hypothetical protein